MVFAGKINKPKQRRVACTSSTVFSSLFFLRRLLQHPISVVAPYQTNFAAKHKVNKLHSTNAIIRWCGSAHTHTQSRCDRWFRWFGFVGVIGGGPSFPSSPIPICHNIWIPSHFVCNIKFVLIYNHPFGGCAHRADRTTKTNWAFVRNSHGTQTENDFAFYRQLFYNLKGNPMEIILVLSIILRLQRRA